MAWFVLFVAGLFEAVWAISMKYTYGFTRLYPTIFTLAAMAVSVYLLSISLKNLPVGTAYAVWTGIGTIGTVIGSMILFHESADILRILCMLLIVSGIIGLRLLN